MVAYGAASTRPKSTTRMPDSAPDPLTASSSPERRQPGKGLSDDERVHLRGALVGQHRLQVEGVPDGWVLQGDAVGSEDGAALAGHRERFPDVVGLADADLFRPQRAGVLQPPELHRQQHRLTNL